VAGIRKKGDSCYCTFLFQGRRYHFTVGDVTEAQALAKGTEVDETLGLLERCRLALPEGVALEDFVAAGGKVPTVSARPDIEEFLFHVRENATLPWVYPMVAFAAYTGARRSELLRALATDVDLAGRTVTVREKKRVRGRRSSRTAPITPKLAEILREWLAVRPESPFLFCQSQTVTRSKTQRERPTAITKDEAHAHFRRTVADSKWQVLRGYHVLRHSFISALASQGVDQRVIDEVVGHQSEEQRKRYRHLYPGVMREAVARVFG
jgi:integrase